MNVKRFVKELVEEGRQPSSDRIPAAQRDHDWPEVNPLAAGPRAAPRSSESTQGTYLEFFNLTSELVELHWVDFDGNRIPYATLRQGQSARFLTYVGHPWVVSTIDGKEKAVNLPTEGNARAVIRE
jgi:VHL beta domain